MNEYVTIKDLKTIVIDNVENEPLSCYIVQTDKTNISTVDAGIVFNKLICENLKFSEEEILTAIAHEIGHIICHFSTKEIENEQGKEIYADTIACRLGFKESLITLLKKLKSSGTYSDELCSQMSNRIFFIKKLF